MLALLIAPLHAGPVGPDNYDFARFGRAVSWDHGGNFHGWSPTSADVNADRRADLVLIARDAQSWRTWVALSIGDGMFAPGVPWSAAGDWLDSRMLASDLDGDERADLIAVSRRPDFLRISTAISTGSGTFREPMVDEFAGNYAGWSAELGDVDGDSRRDLVLQATDEDGWWAHVALNRGGGRFASPVPWTTAGDFHNTQVGLGDFNGDGRTDIAVDNHDVAGWRSWVALSIGGGNFAAPLQWETPGEFSGWMSGRGDFNGDGRTDLQLWTYDAAGWRSQIAASDGSGSFRQPVLWSTVGFGDSWEFSQGDFNADGAADLIAQRSDAKGWQARVAISLGDGTFITPKSWVDFAHGIDGWHVAAMDASGDGRADIIAQAADASGWRTLVAVSQPCGPIIGNQDDFVGRIAALPNLPGGQIVCFEPGVYDGEILIAGKRELVLVAPHGGVSIESNSFASDATEGRDPGAPLQIWESDFIELDGVAIKNRFTYRETSGPDHAPMISRAIEVIRSRDVTLSNTHLRGAGKQTIYALEADGLTLTGTLVDCYYFCVATIQSSLHAWSSHFRANHAAVPIDDHAIFWTTQSDQTYVNSTMEFVTGKAVFSGVNDFASNVLEVRGDTVVSSNADGWIAQHPNYEGLNLRLRGTYTELADWYFIGGPGSGWQKNAQVCHEPDSGWRHCVGHFNGTASPGVSDTSAAKLGLGCPKPEGRLQSALAQIGIALNR